MATLPILHNLPCEPSEIEFKKNLYKSSLELYLGTRFLGKPYIIFNYGIIHCTTSSWQKHHLIISFWWLWTCTFIPYLELIPHVSFVNECHYGRCCIIWLLSYMSWPIKLEIWQVSSVKCLELSAVMSFALDLPAEYNAIHVLLGAWKPSSNLFIVRVMEQQIYM